MDAAALMRANNSDEAIIVLVGTQPQLRHVPPISSFSTERHRRAQLRRTNRRGISTRSGANHHYVKRCHRLFSSRDFRIEFRKRAASAPSIRR